MPTTPSVPITAEQWAAIQVYITALSGMTQQDLEDRIRALEEAQERDETLIKLLRIVFVIIWGFDLS